MREDKPDDPKCIDTYAKIIRNIKRELHEYIDNPNDQTASALYPAFGSIPFKYPGYDYWVNDADGMHEYIEYASMLFQLFEGYFQALIKEGLKIDKIVRDNWINER